jgi:hypothetical protein
MEDVVGMQEKVFILLFVITLIWPQSPSSASLVSKYPGSEL